jgi:hypothetical protein
MLDWIWAFGFALSVFGPPGSTVAAASVAVGPVPFALPASVPLGDATAPLCSAGTWELQPDIKTMVAVTVPRIHNTRTLSVVGP